MFLAVDEKQQKFAIKALRKDKNFDHVMSSEILNREHSLLQKLVGHPNIINSIETNLKGTLEYQGKMEHIYYTVLEYAEHGALSNFVRRTGPLEEELARVLALQICHAVDFVHNEGY